MKSLLINNRYVDTQSLFCRLSSEVCQVTVYYVQSVKHWSVQKQIINRNKKLKSSHTEINTIDTVFQPCFWERRERVRDRDVSPSVQNRSILHTFMIVYCEQYQQVWIMWKYHVSFSLVRHLSLPPPSQIPLMMVKCWYSCKFWSESLILSLEKMSGKGITDSKKNFYGYWYILPNCSTTKSYYATFISISIFVCSFYCTFG